MMSLPPSESPLPLDSPVANTSSPLLPPLPGLAPLVSPPLAPPAEVVSPPEGSVTPVASPPLPLVNNTVVSPPVLPPPVASSPEPPLVEAPPPHATKPSPPLVEAPPPKSPFIAPRSTPLPHKLPIQPITSPLPPSPLAPGNPPPLLPVPPSRPAIPQTPPVTPHPHPEPPLAPEASPVPLTSPSAPDNYPFVPETQPVILPPATKPGIPPAPALVPPTPPISLPLANANLPVSSKHSNASAGLTLGCVIGGLFLLFVIAIVLLCCMYKRRKNDNALSLSPKDNLKGKLSEQNGLALGAHVNMQDASFFQPPMISSRCSPVMDSCSRNASPLPPRAPYRALGLSSAILSYDELMEATNGFSEANLIGQGGFGYVHKGVLPSGKEIAVKKLKAGSSQGDSEFQAEVEIIGRVHHKHLVSLEGYCITNNERLLVYEFVPNSTLEFHLHGNRQPVMQWATRLKIATGSAKGLAYLHEDCNPTIIHRDIKAANILLDQNFEAKVSDFGLAKSFSGAITHITTRVVGTFGYLAPEYASSGKLTDKSDIYSFGVVLLELITGRPPISDSEADMRNGLVDWARPFLNQALEDRNVRHLVDPRLESNYNVSEMATMVGCAAACVRHSAWLRPRMNQIVRALEGDISANDLNEGIRSMHNSSESSTFDAYQHRDETKEFNMVMASWQRGISGTTSEFGLKLSGSNSEDSSGYGGKDRI